MFMVLKIKKEVQEEGIKIMTEGELDVIKSTAHERYE